MDTTEARRFAEDARVNLASSGMDREDAVHLADDLALLVLNFADAVDKVEERLRSLADAVDAAQAPGLMERGRRLASQRDDLIAQGVDPADLLVPLAPEPPGNSDEIVEVETDPEALGWFERAKPPVALSKGHSDTAPGTAVVNTDDLRDALAWMITLVPSMGNAPSVARLRAALDRGEA